jgi:type I restriction enzyme S subunit
MKLEAMPLSKLASVKSGGGAPQDPSAFTETGFPFVRAGSLPKLIDGADEESLEQLERGVAEEHGLSLFPAGTVLFAKSGMSATKGHVYRLKTPAYVVNHLAALIPHAPEDSAFLVRVLQRFPPTTLIKDAAYPSIRLGDIENMKVLAPSGSKERRLIAEILDRADALRATRRAATAQLDTITQSIFLDMFGDPATNPKGIRKQPLGELLKLKSGDFLPASEMAESGTYAVLGGNGISGFHNKYMFEEPQIVIGRVGAYCGCVHVSPVKSWITDNALYVSERHPDLQFDYLVHALEHARLNQYASQFGQPLVSGARIYPVQILVPPKDTQKSFVARAAHLQKLRHTHKTSQDQLDVLFASLQHRAFRGNL